MNNNFDQTLDKNYTQALKLYETEFTHTQLLELLRNGNLQEKHIAALKLKKITSKEDAEILISNLTGQDGKIREAISLRLKDFMQNKEYTDYFNNLDNCDKFIDAITDINGNICRNTICALKNLRNNSEFCNIFCTKLAKLTFNLLDKVEKFNFQDGKYKVNKEAFKLYWCLEAIFEFWDKMDFDALKKIILRAKNIGEYTIREKTAKILSRPINDAELNNIREELKRDPNYYVRRF